MRRALAIIMRIHLLTAKIAKDAKGVEAIEKTKEDIESLSEQWVDAILKVGGGLGPEISPGELALAGFLILIKVPPPEFRQGLPSSGYLYASTHPSGSTHFFDLRALRFAVLRASGGQAVLRPASSLRRLQDAKVESRHGRFAMRKTRFLAFFEAHDRAGHSGIRVGFRGSGMSPALSLLQYRSCAPGPPLRARAHRGRFAIPRLRSSTVGPPWPMARRGRRRFPADTRSRLASLSASPAAHRDSLLAALRLRQPGATSVQGSLDDSKVNR